MHASTEGASQADSHAQSAWRPLTSASSDLLKASLRKCQHVKVYITLNFLAAQIMGFWKANYFEKKPGAGAEPHVARGKHFDFSLIRSITLCSRALFLR